MINPKITEAVVYFFLIVLVFSVVSCSSSSKSDIAIFQDSHEIKYKTGEYDFSFCNIGVCSTKVEFIIKNEGQKDLLLTGTPKIEVVGNDADCFVVDDSMTSSTIVKNVTTSFAVNFRPLSPGKKNAIISIANNDKKKNPFTFIVRGDGNPKYEWTKNIGEYNDIKLSSTKEDNDGNLYITGSFINSYDFGFNFGTSDIKTSKGESDIYLTKINANGTYAWTKQFGGDEEDIGYEIAIDTKNNVYLIGQFRDKFNFGEDFGAVDEERAAGIADVFLTKLSSNGDYEWTHIFGNSRDDKCQDIVCDSNDNVYILCNFEGYVNYGNPFGILDIKQPYGTIITKIDFNGDYGWSKQFKASGNCLSIDSQDNIVIKGGFVDFVNFGADFGIVDEKGRSGIYITKITDDANYIWTKRIPIGSGSNSLCIDSQDNIYFAGDFSVSSNFGEDFGIDDTKDIEYDNRNIFITKIHEDASYGWTKQIYSSKPEWNCNIAIDNEDNLLITGNFHGTVDFGKDFGESDIINSLIPDSDYLSNIYLTKISENAEYCWTKHIVRGALHLTSQHITICKDGDIYLSGSFTKSVDFGEQFGATEILTTLPERYNIFLMKLTS